MRCGRILSMTKDDFLGGWKMFAFGKKIYHLGNLEPTYVSNYIFFRVLFCSPTERTVFFGDLKFDKLIKTIGIFCVIRYLRIKKIELRCYPNRSYTMYLCNCNISGSCWTVFQYFFQL